MPTLTAWEGSAIPIPAEIDRHVLTERLLRISAGAPVTCFRMKHGRLHAAEVVGCVQAGSVRLDILPKTDTPEEDRDRSFLLSMLRHAGHPASRYLGSAQVRATVRDPLEMMIAEVAREIAEAARQGVPRRYEERAEDARTLRGRIDFNRLSRRLPTEMAVLPIRHAPLNVDNVVARCIKWIASTLLRVTRSSTSRQVFTEILRMLAVVEDRVPTRAELDRITLSRLESRWSRAIAVGRLLVEGRFMDPTAVGGSEGFAVLFPLQHLFERVMRKVLVQACQPLDIEATHRSEQLFLLEDAAGQELIRLRPDHLFRRDGALVAVADCKWKRLSRTARAHGVEREDLYQINAYLTRYGVRTSIVFVPKAPWMPDGWTAAYAIPATDRAVHLMGVDIERLVSRDAMRRQEALTALSSCLAGILARP